MSIKHYDLLGIGLGPFNLSIAALASTKSEISTLFLERNKHTAWHPGLLLNDAKMQTSYLKDLVTGVDPTNPYSFLNYLVEHNKFYPFVASSQSVISRLEFSDYLRWAAHKLPNTNFDKEVISVKYQDNHFQISTAQQTYYAKHLVVGTGMQAKLPQCCEKQISDQCFHASELGLRKPDLSGKRVAIIGGGQTGADVFQHLFDGSFGQVKQLSWVSRRANIEALDESCFTDQYFMPDYVRGFYHLEQDKKDSEVNRQKLTSDGITNDCLLGIYQRLYHDQYVLKRKKWWSIKPNQSLVSLQKQPCGYQLQLQHGLTDALTQLDCDVVILCTGYQRSLPAFLQDITEQIPKTAQGAPILCPDFNLKWQGSNNNRIYMVNAGIQSHGIAEPQLSLATWRAAKIINHASGKALYNLNETNAIIDWELAEPDQTAQQESADIEMLETDNLKKVVSL